MSGPATMTPAEALDHWVREREAIRIRKDKGLPQPWTDDAILAKYRFCNVRREDDRVTVWIRKHIREPFTDHPNLWFMLAIARWINWPDTLRELIGGRDLNSWPGVAGFDLHALRDALARIEQRGEQVYNAAYTINAPAKKGASKIDHVAQTVLGEVWRNRDRVARVVDGAQMPATLRAVHAELMRYPGWGEFMAYQVVVDLRFTRYLRDAEDVSTWTAAGPGTIRGLNRVAGRRTNFPLEQWKALHEMRALYETLPTETGVAMDFSDIPNVLCETDKYIRVLNGEGAPRALYHPAASTHSAKVKG